MSDVTQADSYVVVAISNNKSVAVFGPYPNTHAARQEVNRCRRQDREHDWREEIHYVVSPVIHPYA